MNLLLINPPGNVSFISPPLGLMYIAAVIRNENHKVHIIDYNIEKLENQALFDFILKENISAVGISIVTPKVYNSMDIANDIRKQFPKINIIAGGPHATLMPEVLLNECPAFNFVIQGEGEFRLKDLIYCLDNNLSYENIDGLAYFKDNNIVNNAPKGYIEDLNTLPMPARDLVDIQKYSSFMKTVYSPATTMMTSRGCPYQCIYCSKPVTGSKVRSTEPEKVIEEIEFLIKEYKIKEIVFYDDSFTFNQERAMKLCDLMIEKKINIKWHCETRVNLVNPELLSKMKQAGCYLIGFGLESGTERGLKMLKKGIKLEQITTAISQTKKAGIKVLGYFMLGIPGETEDEIKQTIKFSRKLNVDFAQYAIATAYPGTELYQIAKSQNKITKDWSKSIYALGGKPIISLSDIPVEKLYSYSRKAYISFYFRPSFIINKIKGIKTLDDLIYYFKGLKTLFKI